MYLLVIFLHIADLFINSNNTEILSVKVLFFAQKYLIPHFMVTYKNTLLQLLKKEKLFHFE